MTWLAYTAWSTATFLLALPFALAALVLRLLGAFCEWAVEWLEVIGFAVMKSGGW